VAKKVGPIGSRYDWCSSRTVGTGGWWESFTTRGLPDGQVHKTTYEGEKAMPRKRTKRTSVKKGGVTQVDTDDLEKLDACGGEIREVDAQPDDGLPMAVGGIEVDAGEGHEACGCDLEFDDFDATGDEELPAAKGGVV
jgi:hypothetical protein